MTIVRGKIDLRSVQNQFSQANHNYYNNNNNDKKGSKWLGKLAESPGFLLVPNCY